MPTILVGTDDGIHTAGDEPAQIRLPGREVGALVARAPRDPDPNDRSTGAPPRGSPDPSGRSTGAPPWGSPDPSGDGVWALVDGRELWRGEVAGEGRTAASSPGPRLSCLAATGGTVLAGTAEAHLLRLEAGELRRVEPFDQVDGRDGWYTPWGGPPGVRSVAVGADGALWVNVHVGGIPTSPDGGRTWRPTIDVDADVHQVVAHPDDPGRVLAATARGLADSADAGGSWTYLTEGMHAGYCRAVALAGDTVVVSSSTGPRGGRATLYRRPLDAPAEAPFERCRDGLPEWFQGNIDTACVDASGSTVAFGTAAGEVFASEDAGVTWERVAAGLPPVRCLLLVA